MMIPPRSAKRKPYENSEASSLLARRARANTTIGFSPTSLAPTQANISGLTLQQSLQNPQSPYLLQLLLLLVQHPYHGSIASPLTPSTDPDRSNSYFKRLSLVPENADQPNKSESLNSTAILDGNNTPLPINVPGSIMRNNTVTYGMNPATISQIQRKQSQTQLQTSLFLQKSADFSYSNTSGLPAPSSNPSSNANTVSNSTGHSGVGGYPSISIPSSVSSRKPLSMDQIMYAGRKLLFVSSEIYSLVKKFNSVGNNDDFSLLEMVGQYVLNCKKKINLLVEVLEQFDNGTNASDLKSPELVLLVLIANIMFFKKFIDFISNNITGFVQWQDMCFIRLFLLSIFGCYNELMNVYKSLFPEAINSTPLNNINNSNDSTNTEANLKSVSSNASLKTLTKNEVLLNVSNISRNLSQKLSKTIIESPLDLSYGTTSTSTFSNIPVRHQEALIELVQVCQRTQTFADAIQKNLVDEVSITKTSLETFISTIINFLEIFKKLLLINESENNGQHDIGTTSYSVILDLRSFRAEMSNLSRASKDLIYITSH